MKPRPFVMESLWVSRGLFVYKTVDKRKRSQFKYY